MRLSFDRSDIAGFVLVWLATVLLLLVTFSELSDANAQDKPDVVNATLMTPIAPTYNGEGGNLSFMRFFNTNSGAASTFNVMIVGSPSGNAYGNTTTFTVPANASHQRNLTEILTQAGAGPLIGGDTNYTLYIRNSDGFSAFQHVIYNSVNGFFENATICQFFSGAQHTRVVPVVANMHTSRIAQYPSEITVHNYTNVARAYTASVFDSVSGATLGDVTLNVGANTTARLTTASIEQQLNFTPNAQQFHMNVKLGNAGSTLELTALIGHNVLNNAFNGTFLNLTQLCRVKT
ncbi:MAG: hypothetical protein SFV19_18855 [Rhodospirillaceae bacterium]|nr:hypothetical protein [Rhodospirillaceae bacterium]